MTAFLRESTQRATPVQMRATAKLLSRGFVSNQAIQERYNLLLHRFDGVQSVFDLEAKTPTPDIVFELKKRGDEFEKCERELFSSNCKIKDLELKLADQRAFFVQHELLRFKKRGYRITQKYWQLQQQAFPRLVVGIPFASVHKVTLTFGRPIVSKCSNLFVARGRAANRV
jgi:hypothetical protein